MALPALYGIGPQTPIIDARPLKKRGGGTLSTLGQFTDAGGQLAPPQTGQAPSAANSTDFEQSIRDLMSQYDKRDAEMGKQIAPLLKSADDLTGQIQKLHESMQPEDPYALDKLKTTAETAQTQTEKAALELRGPQTSDYTPFEFNDPYPKQSTLPVPQRPEAKVNPVASILAGIGGFIAPQGAAHFASSAIHGAVERANQTYQDALRTRQMKLEELEQNHKDELAARNEALRIAEDNFERDQANDLANLLAEGKYAEAHSKLEGELAKDKVLGTDLEGLSVRAKARNQVLDQIAALKEKKAAAQEMTKMLLQLQEKSEALQERRTETLLRVHEQKYQADKIDQLRQAMIDAGYVKSGYTPPAQIGGLPTPTPNRNLSLEAQAKIALQHSQTKAANALARERDAKEKQIAAGKPGSIKALRTIDPTYNKLYTDYIAKQRAIQHSEDAIRNPMVDETQKIEERNLIAKNFKEFKEIGNLMHQKEQDYLAQTRATPAKPASPAPSKKSDRNNLKSLSTDDLFRQLVPK